MAHYKGAATDATRAMQILKKREKAREELELKKKKIEDDLKMTTIDSKFSTHNDAIENQLRSSTVGLVTLDQMRQRQINAVIEREKQIARGDDDRPTDKDALGGKKPSSSSGHKKKKIKYLDSEDDGDDDDEGHDGVDRKIKRTVETEPSLVESTSQSDTVITESKEQSADEDGEVSKSSSRRKILNLDIDTSFLPDRDREEEERRLREKLAAEWREKQQRLKEEEIEITFSYWDGSGHRRFVKMKKGHSIYQFLQACLETLRKDFNELRAVSADQLMFVKEDLIIPHHYTFYDFIVNKARGKSGPLFSFDVHEDVRLTTDATVEKDETHAGKVLLRSWYERNKHIFPASRWEPYDPNRTYESYTISDKRAR